MFNRYRGQLQALYDIIDVVTAVRDADGLLADIVGKLTEALAADRATLYLVDAETGGLWSRVMAGGAPLEIRLGEGQGLAGWVAMSRVPVVIDNVLKDDRFDGRWDQKSGYRTRTMLAVPILLHGELVGVLQVLNKNRGTFDDDDRRFLQAVASVCGPVVQNLGLT